MNEQPIVLAVQQRLREYIKAFAKLSPEQQESELNAQLARLSAKERVRTPQV